MLQGKEVKVHGHNIWAFLNIRTNQVIYSLSRRLEESALKQLPDIGANHTPPALRKDHWRPFFHVSIPPRVHTWRRLQGLDIYRTLREWRTLHETSWEPSPLLSRLWSEDEIKEWQEKLDAKGGSKKMTVFDLIKREKKKLRLRTIMDQKANSVADLAAVLNSHHDPDGKVTEVSEAVKKALRQQHREELVEMIRLAPDAVKQRSSTRPRGLEKQVVRIKKDETIPKWKRAQEVKALRAQLRKMYWCREELERTARAVSHHEWAIYESILKKIRDQAIEGSEASASSESLTEAWTKAQEKAGALYDALSYLKAQTGIEVPLELQKRNSGAKERARVAMGEEPNLPEAAIEDTADPSTATEETSGRTTTTEGTIDIATATEVTADPATTKKGMTRPVAELEDILLPHAKRMPSKFVDDKAVSMEMNAIPKALYGTKGITVRWSNLLDAEFAAAWPADVKHVYMNIHKKSRGDSSSDAPKGKAVEAEDIPVDVESSPSASTNLL